MVSGAGWVMGHPGDAKIILLHLVLSMSLWTRWIYERLLFPDNLHCVGGDVKSCSLSHL